MVPHLQAVENTEELPPPFPIEPYEDVVFIEQHVEEKSKGGLILAGDIRKLPAGRVVAVGPGRYFHPPMDATGNNSGAVFVPTNTKVGDYVVFGRYQSGGEPLEIDGRRYLLCREGDLAGRSKSGKPLDVRIAVDLSQNSVGLR
jgi:co-chaperonin GroES (HSP10)